MANNNISTKNKTHIRYEELRNGQLALQEEQKALRARLKEAEAESSKFIKERLDRISEIGRSVAKKCLSDRYYTSARSQALGDLNWITEDIQLKSLGVNSIELSRGKRSYDFRTREYSFTESNTFTLSRSILHLSDRDVAKMVRAQIRSWKDEQRAKAAEAQTAGLKDAQEKLAAAQKQIAALEKSVKDEEQKLKALEKPVRKDTRPQAVQS